MSRRRLETEVSYTHGRTVEQLVSQRGKGFRGKIFNFLDTIEFLLWHLYSEHTLFRGPVVTAFVAT